jgi:hypothetical protein
MSRSNRRDSRDRVGRDLRAPAGNGKARARRSSRSGQPRGYLLRSGQALHVRLSVHADHHFGSGISVAQAHEPAGHQQWTRLRRRIEFAEVRPVSAQGFGLRCSLQGPRFENVAWTRRWPWRERIARWRCRLRSAPIRPGLQAGIPAVYRRKQNGAVSGRKDRPLVAQACARATTTIDFRCDSEPRLWRSRSASGRNCHWRRRPVLPAGALGMQVARLRVQPASPVAPALRPPRTPSD